jgi:hypothetical protein
MPLDKSRDYPKDAYVGPYWFVCDDSKEVRLIAHRCAIADAEEYGDCLTCPHGHYDLWESWRIGSAPDGLTDIVRDAEYEEWPRGSVRARSVSVTLRIQTRPRIEFNPRACNASPREAMERSWSHPASISALRHLSSAAMEDEKVNQKEHTFNQRYGLQNNMDFPSVANLVLTVSGIITIIVVGWVKTGEKLRKSVIEKELSLRVRFATVNQNGR